MYQIYADSVLIYDSTLEDYKIGQGEVVREVDKSGSFVFSVYPDHFFYDSFVAMKTVITVYKSGRIVFRGRVLNDVTDYWNNKVLTCEGELGFLQDTIVRPYEFQGAPTALLRQFIEAHNAQVDDFKKFNIGTVDIDDANDYVNRSSTDYAPTLEMMQSALPGSALGGHFYITHGEDGTDPIPTLNYLKDFPDTSTQDIEFGVNLKDYTKTVNAEDLATAIIPLGTNTSTTGERLTIADVNGGEDYIYDETAVALRGWIFKPVVWEDVTLASNLLTKARAYLTDVVKQSITIELNAIDLHLLDRSIASFNVCEYVRVISDPHHLDAVMLCNRQTMNLLKPESDTIVLGYATTSLTGASTDMAASVSTLGKQVSSIRQDATAIELRVEEVSKESKEYTDTQTGEVSKTLTEELKKYSTIEMTSEQIAAIVSESKTYTDEKTGAVAAQLSNYSTIEQTTTSISTAVSETKTYADEKAAGALSDSKTYADEKAAGALSDSKEYTDAEAGKIVKSLESYSTIEQTTTSISTAVSETKTYADEKAAGALSDSKDYADEKAAGTLSDSKTYADEKAAGALSDSKDYTDQKAGAITESLKNYSTLEQTATSISTAVSESKAYTDEQTGAITEELKNYSTIEQTAEAITAAVSDVEKGLETTLRLSADGLSITDAEGNSVTISGSQIDASTIKVEDLDASRIKVEDLQLTGAISFSDLSDASDVQEAIDAANSTAETANTNATTASSNAAAAANAVKAWCYTGTTYIDGSKIMTGTVEASILAGGAVALKSYYGQTAGYLTMDGASTANFAVALASGGALRLTADYGNVFIRNGGNQYINLVAAPNIYSEGRIEVNGADFVPGFSGGYSCGATGYFWSDVYAVNATIQTSDLRVKKDVTYGLDDYEALFDALQPISFRFVDGTSGRVHLGMGAQDVEQAMTDSGLTDMDFAGLIKSPKTDDKGRVVEGEYDYALRYGEFIPLLIEQVQKLKQRVRALEGKS